MFPNGFLLLFIVSLVCCAIGFYRFVWFMSVGYGFSVAGLGVALFAMSIAKGQFSVLFTVECILFIIYGLRLGLFLFIREMKNTSYREKSKEVGGDAKVPVFVAAVMWIMCGGLYILQTSGASYRLLNKAGTNAALVVGIVIAAAGIIIETLADKQKGDAKKINPSMPAMHGLYKMCRCPNYFGEMVFWTGVFVSGIGAVKGVQWIVAVTGYIAILVVMLSGAKRVETRHIKHYGKKEEYNKYADSVPLIFPLIPNYHFTNEKKIAAEEKAKKEKAEKKAKK